MKLQALPFGLAAGILWGAGVFLATLWVMARGGPGEHLALLGRFYPGYTVSILGGILGLIYGFIDGLIGGLIFVWLYNAFAKTGD
jgi:hypothetical protein